MLSTVEIGLTFYSWLFSVDFTNIFPCPPVIFEPTYFLQCCHTFPGQRSQVTPQRSCCWGCVLTLTLYFKNRMIIKQLSLEQHTEPEQETQHEARCWTLLTTTPPTVQTTDNKTRKLHAATDFLPEEHYIFFLCYLLLHFNALPTKKLTIYFSLFYGFNLQHLGNLVILKLLHNGIWFWFNWIFAFYLHINMTNSSCTLFIKFEWANKNPFYHKKKYFFPPNMLKRPVQLKQLHIQKFPHFIFLNEIKDCADWSLLLQQMSKHQRFVVAPIFMSWTLRSKTFSMYTIYHLPSF